MKCCTKNRGGFTLIELLVVITVVAVLMSILLPAFAAARAEATKSKCLTNLRSLLSTAHAYANEDAKGVFGPVHPRASDFRGEGYSDYGGGPGSSPYLGWGQAFDPTTRLFNKLIYGAEGVTQTVEPGNRGFFQEFQCPGDDYGYQEWPGWETRAGRERAPTPTPAGNVDHRRDETEQPYFKTNGTSFRLNNLIWFDGFGRYVAGVYARPLNRIPNTSLVVGFMEARAFQTVWTNDVWGELAVRGELTGYHKKLGYFNVGFTDGHAAFVDMGNGTYYPQVRPNNNFDVRGTWGRMDCHPDRVLKDP